MSANQRKSRSISCCAISVAERILRDADTELSRVCADHLKYGRHNAYLEARVDPSAYSCWREFALDYLSVELLSKFDGLSTNVDRTQVALDKFISTEEHCHMLNARFSSFEGKEDKHSLLVSQVFLHARRKIERVLGDFSWDEAAPFMAFGPGASVGLQRKYSHSWYKFGLESPTSTGECAIPAEIFIKMSPQWSSIVFPEGKDPGNLLIVRGSRITTVPKSAKTDRVIAIEPLMNMFFQKGIGGVLRRRLKRVGVDLNDQCRNQELARKGSADGTLATIDLSSASDTISRGLVEYLLPESWVTAMKICRSKHSTLPSGEEIFLQKFASMGNGFCFELESLIFWALAGSVCSFLGASSHDLSVYGDDIIIPVEAVDSLFHILSFAGFLPNEKKSYWNGPFRESCGKHYFSGHDVTPIYIRKNVSSQDRYLWLANSIKRFAHRILGCSYGCDARFRDTYDYVCRLIPSKIRRLSIPEGFGNGGLVRDFDEARPSRHRYYDAWKVRLVQRQYSSFEPYGMPALVLSLFCLERGDREPLVVHHSRENPYGSNATKPQNFRGFPALRRVPRGRVVPFRIPTERYRDRIIESYTPRWWGLGPWV